MSVSGERELEEFLAGALSGKEQTTSTPPDDAAEETVTPPEEVVHDEAPGVVPPAEDGAPVPPLSPDAPPAAAEAEETPAEEPAEGEEEDSNVVWATKKFGKEPANWAKAAYEREQHISRLTQEKQQAEQVAAEAIQYARNAEANAGAAQRATMPLSSAEEMWVDEAMSNPVGYAYTAARNGNAQLYNAVIERVAEDNPGYAAQIGTQVSMALREEQARYEAEQAAAQNGQPSGDLNSDLGQSFERLGIDIQKYGQAIWEKLEELGEYNRYTQEILGGDARTRDLALQAVYDLVRAGTTTTRRVADTEREEQIRREGELRREAASVVTGSPHVEPTKQDPLFAGMEEEWRRRGQWPYPEE